MWNEPRNWKWMVPGSLFVILAVLGAWMFVQDWADGYWWTWASMWGVACICFMSWIVNLWAYINMHWTNNYIAIKRAEYETPMVRMFEAAKGLQTDAVAALLAQWRLLWRIKYVAVGDLVDWILDEAPSVRAGFVDFVLDYSSNTSVMPISMLSEGSKQFDPDGVITDREQYESLLILMQNRLMCTRAYGNQPPKWIEPWNPSLARHRFGLDEGNYEAEGTNMLEAVRRAREMKAGNGSDPLRAIKKQIEQDALDGLQQTAEMRKKYQASMKVN